MAPYDFKKDPDAVLDFAFDWVKLGWLETDETISSYTITVGTGLVNDSDSEADGVVTVWLSGGTAESYYAVACEITTNGGRTDERTMIIWCTER